ncbi:MAG: CvpA family protein [Oscillospiraceae bacterium]|nr:CvpA family protein [Oscillospiraceae bacterium]
MSFVLDIILVCIIVYCAIRGWQKGFLISLCGIVAVIIAIVGGNIAAKVYCNEFVGLIDPFTTGITEKLVLTVTGDVPPGEEGARFPLTNSERKDVYTVCNAAMREFGLPEDVADEIARTVAEDNDTVNEAMGVALAEQLTQRFAYLAVFTVAFVIILLVLSVVGSILDLRLELPKLRTANNISGAVLGAVKGLLIVMVIALICRYVVFVLGIDTVEKTTLLEGMANHNLIADHLGL